MAGFIPLRQDADFQVGLMGAQGADESPPDGAAAVEPPSAQGPESVASPPAGADLTDASASTQPEIPEGMEDLLREAEERGRANAAAVLDEERATLQAERVALTCLIDSIDQAKLDWSAEVRGKLGEVLVVGLRQLVSESTTLQAAALKQRISEVGDRLIGEEQVLLKVRSQDVALAKELLGDREGWQIVPDDTLAGGGCVAETEGGKVDATMGAAVAGLSGAVRDWISGTGGDEE